MILCVVFTVFMIFWLFSGYSMNAGDKPPSWAPMANTIIPWACVAILGWVIFNGVGIPGR